MIKGYHLDQEIHKKECSFWTKWEFIFSFQIGTGLKDEELDSHSKFFKTHVIDKPRPYYRHDTSHIPDHWFDAVQVWEVKAADLSISPTHRAAIGIVSHCDGIIIRLEK